MELAKREKEAGIIPEGDVDAYMKVTHLFCSTNHPPKCKSTLRKCFEIIS